MKAYVTSIGELTTEICCNQLKKYGFEVILLDQQEPWLDKYKRFISMAKEDCIRVDADVIVNSSVKIMPEHDKYGYGYLMVQGTVFDFYKNDIHSGIPLFYTKKALDIIRKNLDKLHPERPEATAWRLPQINKHTYTSYHIYGMHGFFQRKKDMERAERNKKVRGQKDYDFALAWELMKRFYVNL